MFGYLLLYHAEMAQWTWTFATDIDSSLELHLGYLLYRKKIRFLRDKIVVHETRGFA